MKEQSPIEIKNRIAKGDITPEEAVDLFRQTHGGDGEMVSFERNPRGRFLSFFKEKKDYVFNHQMAYDQYLDRKDLEEGIKHTIGMVAFGATGIIDGTLEGLVYLATEVEETASFFVGRSINRVKDGWQRGLRDQ